MYMTLNFQELGNILFDLLELSQNDIMLVFDSFTVQYYFLLILLLTINTNINLILILLLI